MARPNSGRVAFVCLFGARDRRFPLLFKALSNLGKGDDAAKHQEAAKEPDPGVQGKLKDALKHEPRSKTGVATMCGRMVGRRSVEAPGCSLTDATHLPDDHIGDQRAYHEGPAKT